MRKALHDSGGVLLEHGFTEYVPVAGQFVRDVADDFALEPRKCRWNGTAYETMPAPTQDQRAALAVDGVDRLQFDALFNHENRIRAAEGKIAITQAQFRDALIARWKAMNP